MHYYVKWIYKTTKVRSYKYLSVKEKDSKCTFIPYPPLNLEESALKALFHKELLLLNQELSVAF